jgi:hypothetical protein
MIQIALDVLGMPIATMTIRVHRILAHPELAQILRLLTARPAKMSYIARLMRLANPGIVNGKLATATMKTLVHKTSAMRLWIVASTL